MHISMVPFPLLMKNTSSTTYAEKGIETVLILDFGSQYAQLIARRVREAGAFSLLMSPDTPIEELKKHGYKIIKGFLAAVKIDGEPIDRELLALKQKKIQNALNKQEKVAITIESGELSRGRGGPRCMTMPINRIK